MELAALLFVLGLILGVCVTMLLYSIRKPEGTLKIDRSNPERDKYLFVINEDLDTLPKKKRITLNVDPNADLSQK